MLKYSTKGGLKMSDFNNNYDFGNDYDLEFTAKRTENKKGFLYVFSIVIFALGFLISCIKVLVAYKEKTASNNTSFALGNAVGVAIGNIVIILLLFLLIKRVKKKAVVLIIAIIYLMVSFSSTSVALDRYVKGTKANKAAIEKFKYMANAYSVGKEIPKENFDKSVFGNMTPFLNSMNSYLIKCKQMQTNAEKDMASLDFYNMLSASTLSSPAKINTAKERLAASFKFLDKYEGQAKDLINNFNTEVSTLDLPSSFKTGFSEGYKRSQNEAINMMGNLFEIQREIFTKANITLDFMLSIQGKYKVQGNQIIFYDNDTLNKYNGYIQDIEKLNQAGTKLKASIQDKIKENVTNLNNIH